MLSVLMVKISELNCPLIIKFFEMLIFLIIKNSKLEKYKDLNRRKYLSKLLNFIRKGI